MELKELFICKLYIKITPLSYLTILKLEGQMFLAVSRMGTTKLCSFLHVKPSGTCINQLYNYGFISEYLNKLICSSNIAQKLKASMLTNVNLVLNSSLTASYSRVLGSFIIC